MKKIFINAGVYTGNGTFAEAFIVDGDTGLFTFTGSAADALAQACPGDETHDISGLYAVSGFNDSHMHILNLGASLREARLDEHTGSLSDMLACLREHAGTRAPGEWILGRGWNQDYFTDENRMPNRHDLDRVSTANPVCAVRACGHVLSVNSCALALMGVTAETPDPEGGAFGREADGSPDGILYDNAIPAAEAHIPAPGKEEIKNRIRTALKEMNQCGITSAHSDDYSYNRDIPFETINEVYRELERDGELTVRVYEQCNLGSVSAMEEFFALGYNTGVGSPYYKLGPLKMVGDGALGARTAYLSGDYADKPGEKGLACYTQAEFDAMIGLANRHGMQAAVHAIGDGCLDMVLDAMEKALKECPREDHRHGIVHCQLTRPDQLRRMAALKTHIHYQGIFLDYDARMVHERVGALAESSYRWKTLARMGLSCSNGTDSPVERPDPLRSLQCAVTRKTLDGSVSYLPEEAFTMAEALDGYSIRSAEASFEENVKGRIAPGMYADFVLLGADPFTADPAVIHKIPVKATYVGGKKVYGE